MIAENIARIRERVFTSASRAGRNPQEITVVAVSKKVGVAQIREAVDAGLNIFGENYVQEAKEKISQLGEGAMWHMIGRLQTNKVKHSIPLFSMIQSIGSLHLAEEVSLRAGAAGKTMDVLIQVNIGEETSKGGVGSDQVLSLLGAVSSLQGIRVRGLMGMAPYFLDSERVRPYFQKLRHLRDTILQYLPENISLPHLSMGMSGDFEVAIEEGATMVRIGTAIFGERT